MKYLKSSAIILLGVLIITLITSLLSYFNIINHNILKYINLALMLILSLIAGIYIGKNSNNKGYIAGIKLSGLTMGLMLIISYLIIRNPFSIKGLIFYILNIIIIIAGSIIGINKKETDRNK